MKNKEYGVIYKISNKINNKVYIGLTTNNNGFNGRYPAKGNGIERVYNYYLQNIKYDDYYNKHLLKSIKKYGFDAFEIIEEFDVAYSQEELNKKEKYWISYYNSFNNKNGYNLTIGGEGNNFSKESYMKNMGEKKRYRPFICIETKEIFLTIQEAIDKYLVNRQSLKLVLNKTQKNTYSKKYNKKISFRYITISKGARKPVICLNTKETFLTITDAIKWCNLKKGNGIVECCNNKRKSAGKHPETNESLKWSWGIEYKLNKKLIKNSTKKSPSNVVVSIDLAI